MPAQRRRPVSPSMAVALAALAVALGGSAFAAGGGFSTSDGLVQGCVATRNIVNALTDPLVNATAPLAGSQAIAPKGSLIVVAPGETCPAGTRPQRLSAVAAPSFSSVHGAAKQIGRTKETLTEAMLPGGTYMINATAQITQTQASPVAQLVKCALAGPDGKTIANTTSQATMPAGASGRITMPINALLRHMAPGTISTVCKASPVNSPAAAMTGGRARAAKRLSSIDDSSSGSSGSPPMTGLGSRLKFVLSLEAMIAGGDPE
jgi:hypothetical protein